MDDQQNQGSNPIEPAPALPVPNRRADGTFGPGNNANPDGNKKNKGYAPWETREDQLEEKYPTLRELMQFFTLNRFGGLVPSEALLDLSARDAEIVRSKVNRIIGSSKDTNAALNDYLDRREGKPIATVRIFKGADPYADIDPANLTDEQLDEALKAAL